MGDAPALLLLGLGLGIRHAVDADHVAAVATLVVRERSVRAAGAMGIAWGLGHSVAVVGAGLALVAFGVRVPAAFEHVASLAVALLLVALGAATCRRALRAPVPTGTREDVATGGRARATLVGIAHGLAGSAGITLLVLPTLPTPIVAVAYLLLFALGTVAGMAAISALLAVPLRGDAPGRAHVLRVLEAVAGVVSLVLGLVLLAHA